MDSTETARPDSPRSASFRAGAGTRKDTEPAWSEERSEDTTQPPNSPARADTRSTARSISSTTTLSRAVWTTTRERTDGEAADMGPTGCPEAMGFEPTAAPEDQEREGGAPGPAGSAVDEGDSRGGDEAADAGAAAAAGGETGDPPADLERTGEDSRESAVLEAAPSNETPLPEVENMKTDAAQTAPKTARQSADQNRSGRKGTRTRRNRAAASASTKRATER